jgi:hypothetical protein
MLLFNQLPKAAAHGAKRIADDRRQLFVKIALACLARHYHLVFRRHRDIDSNPKRIAAFLVFLRFLDRDPAADSFQFISLIPN